MKIRTDYHYLVRVRIEGEKPDYGWQCLCYPCLAKFNNERPPGGLMEIVSYSQLACGYCGNTFKMKEEGRPAFKMRTVRYQIVASYPEWDHTA